jgi:hypothetical protein
MELSSAVMELRKADMDASKAEASLGKTEVRIAKYCGIKAISLLFFGVIALAIYGRKFVP